MTAIPTYVTAAFLEIAGCFAFWAWLRLGKPAWLGLPGVISLAVVLIPYWDKEEADIGIYFRSQVGKLMALAGALLAMIFVPLLVFLDINLHDPFSPAVGAGHHELAEDNREEGNGQGR